MSRHYHCNRRITRLHRSFSPASERDHGRLLVPTPPNSLVLPDRQVQSRQDRDIERPQQRRHDHLCGPREKGLEAALSARLLLAVALQAAARGHEAVGVDENSGATLSLAHGRTDTTVCAGRTWPATAAPSGGTFRRIASSNVDQSPMASLKVALSWGSCFSLGPAMSSSGVTASRI